MKYLYGILIAALFLFILSLSFTGSNDFNQDLGRHLKLAEIIIRERSVPSTNLFSYTNPGFPFVNHHWLSEIIFYGFVTVFGLSSLIFLKVILIIASVGAVTYVAYLRSNVTIAIICSFLLAPLLLDRPDIRPELFGYLLFSFMMVILYEYKRLPYLLYIIPVIMLLWVNLHISFIFGGLISVIIFAQVVYGKIMNTLSRQHFLKVCAVMAVGFIAVFINPNGVTGALYPLRIFGNYGYTIVENQNVFFLNDLIFNPVIRYLFFLSPLIIIAILVLLWKKKFTDALLLSIFFIASMSQIRHLPFFFFAAVPPASTAVYQLLRRLIMRQGIQIMLPAVFLPVMLIASMILMNGAYYRTFDIDRTFGLMMARDYDGAMNFIKTHKLPRQIYNNFDIGGYAIYSLYPEYKMFVDNRPEAYPKEFMQDVYIKLQEQPELRKKVFSHYDIRTIVMNHTDQTPWAATFLTQIIKDDQWILAYLDTETVVFTQQSSIKNIRNDEAYFKKIVTEQTDYVKLLKVSRILGMLGKQELSSAAVTKAAELNPDSCAIQRFLHKESYWYCN